MGWFPSLLVKCYKSKILYEPRCKCQGKSQALPSPPHLPSSLIQKRIPFRPTPSPQLVTAHAPPSCFLHSCQLLSLPRSSCLAMISSFNPLLKPRGSRHSCQRVSGHAADQVLYHVASHPFPPNSRSVQDRDASEPGTRRCSIKAEHVTPINT